MAHSPTGSVVHVPRRASTNVAPYDPTWSGTIETIEEMLGHRGYQWSWDIAFREHHRKPIQASGILRIWERRFARAAEEPMRWWGAPVSIDRFLLEIDSRLAITPTAEWPGLRVIRDHVAAVAQRTLPLRRAIVYSRSLSFWRSRERPCA